MLTGMLYPKVKSMSQDLHQAEIELLIPSNLAYLQGHFDDFPVVPGVAQVHWAIQYAKDLLGPFGELLKTTRIKFSSILQPNDNVSLYLNLDGANSCVAFKFKSEEKLFSSGQIHFRPASCMVKGHDHEE